MKLGKLRIIGSLDYFTGMLAGVGIGIFLAPLFIPSEQRVGNFWALVVAFGCPLLASVLRTNLKKQGSESERRAAAQKNEA